MRYFVIDITTGRVVRRFLSIKAAREWRDMLCKEHDTFRFVVQVAFTNVVVT